jgi:hypothetical protein
MITFNMIETFLPPWATYFSVKQYNFQYETFKILDYRYAKTILQVHVLFEF